MRADDRALADVAASVADGEPVDWAAAEARLPAADRRLVRHLRLVENISTLYRTLPPAGAQAPGEASAPALRRWGTLALLERIGEGTTGEVYRAWDTRLHRDVALKLLHHDRSRTDAQERVLEEARRLARLRHEHVVSVYGAEEHDGRVGLWMELVRGESLEARVKAHGRLEADEAARIGGQICAALTAVHASGLLHRDVKAQNVIQESSGRIVLMDFGTGEELRRAQGTNRMVGTPLYLAPEIFKGQAATVQSDIYSLGVLLFYLVTGEFPVKASSMLDLGRAHSRGERRRLADLRPDLPPAFADVVDRALDPAPERRFRTAGGMEAALGAARVGTEVDARAAARVGIAWWRKPLAAVAALLLVATVALIVWTSRTTGPSAGAIKRLAVTPMAPIDPSTAPPFFAEGLTDQLISTLGQIQSLRVRFVPGSAVADSSGASSSNGVDARLDTTLLATGSPPRVRVNARLIAAGSDTVIWARTFEHALGDTFALQAAMAREIATAVNAAITPEEATRLNQSRRTTPEAEAAFLEGRAYIERYGVDAAQRALDAFRRAIAADPNHAAAHAGAARAYFTLGDWSALSPPVARTAALREAQAAIELNDALPDAHATLAAISFHFDWNWKSAEAGYLRSLNLNPNHRYARTEYARLLAAARRTIDAVVQAEIAVDLEPRSAEVHRLHALMLYYHRDFVAAERAIAKSLEFEPDAPSARVLLGRIAEATGDLYSASNYIESASHLMQTVPVPLGVEQLRHRALRGDANQALAGMTKLRHDSDASGILWNPVFDAYFHVALGQYEQALSFLDQAIEQRQPRLLWLAVDPRMDPIRDHPRFRRIIQNLGLDEQDAS